MTERRTRPSGSRRNPLIVATAGILLLAGPVRSDSLTLKTVEAPSGCTCRVRMIVPFSFANTVQEGRGRVSGVPGSSSFICKPATFREHDPAYVVDLESEDIPRVASSAELEKAEAVLNVPSRRSEAGVVKTGRFRSGLRFNGNLYPVSRGTPVEFYFSRDGRYAVVESIRHRFLNLGYEIGNGREATYIEFFHAQKPGGSIGKLVFHTDYELLPAIVPYPRWLDDEYFIVPTRLDRTQAVVCRFPKSQTVTERGGAAAQ